jgi:phage-related protein
MGGIADAIGDAILSVAREVLNTVTSMINQQVQAILEQVTNPIKQMIQGVTNGIWRGNGANAFVDEMQNMVIPNLDSLGGSIGNIGTSCTKALDIIDQVDDTVSGIINGITDVFNFF